MKRAIVSAMNTNKIFKQNLTAKSKAARNFIQHTTKNLLQKPTVNQDITEKMQVKQPGQKLLRNQQLQKEIKMQ